MHGYTILVRTLPLGWGSSFGLAGGPVDEGIRRLILVQSHTQEKY